MTGPKPKLNNGRIAIQYVTGSNLVHHCNLDVDIIDPTGSPPYSIRALDTTPVLWSVAAVEFVTLAKALYGSDSSFQTATLYDYSAGIYNPIDFDTLGVLGTATGATTLAQETTFVYRDANRNLDKIVFLETVAVGVDRNAIAGLTGAELAFVNDTLTFTSGHIGYWYQSKDAVFLLRFLARTKSYNRRLRRKLGLG